MIHLHDKTFEPFISSEEISFAIVNMAKQMDDDFFDEIPVFSLKNSPMSTRSSLESALDGILAAN